MVFLYLDKVICFSQCGKLFAKRGTSCYAWEVGKSMGEFIISDSGVKVFVDYRNNISIDKNSKVLATKAAYPREKYQRGRVKGLSRLGSENSEDAKTWNLFRAMEVNNRLNEYYQAIGVADKCNRVLFWGMDSNTAEFDKVLKSILDEIEPWSGQQTEPDVVILGDKTIIFNESKLGKDGSFIDAWGRKEPFTEKHSIYKEKAKFYFTDDFIKSFNIEGRRYYQLMRNFIIGQTYASHLHKEFHLVALVSDKNKSISGLSHQEEFNNFLSHLRESVHCHLLTWEQFEEIK